MHTEILGFSILLLSLIGLTSNLILLLVLAYLSQCSKHNYYLIAIFTILVDSASLPIAILYTAPSIIFQSFLYFDSLDSVGSLLLADAGLFFWDMYTFSLVMMVANRLAVIVFEKGEVFTDRRIYAYYGVASVLTFIKVVSNHVVFPCCLSAFNFRILAGEQIGEGFNSSLLVDIAIESIVSIVIIVSYTVIFLKIRTANNSIKPFLGSKNLQTYRARERSCALQFASISFWYVFSTYNPFPIYWLFGSDCHLCNFVVPFCSALCSTVNALVFIGLNKEVKRVLKERLIGTSESSKIIVTI